MTAAGAGADVACGSGDDVAPYRGGAGGGEERWVGDVALGACVGVRVRMGLRVADEVCCLSCPLCTR